MILITKIRTSKNLHPQSFWWGRRWVTNRKGKCPINFLWHSIDSTVIKSPLKNVEFTKTSKVLDLDWRLSNFRRRTKSLDRNWKTPNRDLNRDLKRNLCQGKVFRSVWVLNPPPFSSENPLILGLDNSVPDLYLWNVPYHWVSQHQFRKSLKLYYLTSMYRQSHNMTISTLNSTPFRNYISLSLSKTS